jgi:hypothetical protein
MNEGWAGVEDKGFRQTDPPTRQEDVGQAVGKLLMRFIAAYDEGAGGELVVGRQYSVFGIGDWLIWGFEIAAVAFGSFAMTLRDCGGPMFQHLGLAMTQYGGQDAGNFGEGWGLKSLIFCV